MTIRNIVVGGTVVLVAVLAIGSALSAAHRPDHNRFGRHGQPACGSLPCLAAEPYANRRNPARRVTHADHAKKVRLARQNLPCL